MKTIQFVLSILVSICAAGMLYGAITTYSPMKIFSMSVICVGCVSLMRITYRELKTDR